MAFGLVSSTTTASYKSLNSRRKIFLQYPNGAAPLMGLLSMMPNGEETDKPEFGWWERRFPTQRTTTAASGTAVFAAADGTALADPVTLNENQEYRVKVADTSQFKPTHVVEIRDVVYNGTATGNIQGIVTQVVNSTTLLVRLTGSWTSVETGTTDNNALTVMIIGTANRENARSGVGVITFPVNPTNYTQIFRTAFSISRTALKGGLTYDSSGPYRDLAWNNGIRHMIEMEKAFLFGRKHTVGVSDPDTGDVTPETKTGGIIYHLEQWEAANSIYRGGAGAAAITSQTDPDKRIINLGGTLTRARMNQLFGYAFKQTNDKAYEKVCLCGGGFLDVINTLFERDVVRNVAMQEKSRNWEFIVHSLTTLRGTIHFKVHPLLDNDPDWQDGAFILDLGNMKHRPLSDSDTKFLKGRQETDRDGRKDEWITEAGLELHFPESCMVIQNATTAG